VFRGSLIVAINAIMAFLVYRKFRDYAQTMLGIIQFLGLDALNLFRGKFMQEQMWSRYTQKISRESERSVVVN